MGGLRGTGAGASGEEQREGSLVQGTVLPFLASQALVVHPFNAPQNAAMLIAATFRALGRCRAVAQPR